MADVDRLLVPLADGDAALVPLGEGHREALRAACAADTEIWPTYNVSYDPDHFDASFDALIANPARLAFAILHDGDLVGMTAYLGVDAAKGLLEIGNTYIAPVMRGTGFNRRIKEMQIDHAIACGFRRIEFRIDVRNARSMAAVAKLGGVKEGVLRQERVTWNGHLRDTALYSILADEWRRS
ncbi:Protein N-acetyltransferase, RimJ/RimL family [Sphingomonas laterariae]|uniref:Protein N-acetyltransferase, RimJ/RimL family n=1 Tax=Edaphosphingomonas laterariae TaxID=861865 RepID=A0A239KTS0_9SPHN|nr:GNAT family protein [Sphingomonas laterariae]SNT21611.1 Protein N-acetyltransferase, RimJ/RimL family [Sphingomonas laterariae]